ncbi:MAG: GGDEF domain-containing protein [Porticoccaceae bacterium]|nr:GGDEF domain-containing protein [Porticoccaceae bacterium]
MSSLRNFELKLPNLASICVHVLTIFLLLFFGFSHLLFESFWVGVSCLITLLIAVFSLISVVNRSNNAILLVGFVVCAGITLAVTSYLHGSRGLIYCFPLTASLFFLIRYQTAILIGGTMLVVCSLAALNSMEPLMVARFSFAMAFSLIFLAILAYQLFQQQRQLEQEANEDYLTGLMNQRSFYAWLEKLLASESSLRRKLTLFYFDIDNFKSINDSFGHAGGDLVLKEFSQRIISAVGEINQEFCLDTKMHFCRLSGDEFVLACVNTTDGEMAADVAKRFHNALADPFSIGGRMTLICSSIGVHHFTMENQSLSEVMQLADAAMYKAKKLGEQQFYISEDERESYLREASSAY